MIVDRRCDGASGPVTGHVAGGSDRDRAVSAVVGKALEASLVVLYIALLVTVLYGGVVPEYQTAAGQELGERVLAEATLEVQTSVPEDPATEAEVRYDLPATIQDATYRIEGRGDSLALVHPHAGVGEELPVALPSDVRGVEGEWHSTDPAILRVDRTEDGRIVVLERGES